MGDVKRFRKEVVDSIGAGTASPVRAVFSSAVLGSAVPSADGDTFLMGEMVGVDEGLVIQELSRADELVKLQHELEKQVSKLAELGELKWLEELEKLQTEEIQKVKDSIGEMEKEKIREVKEVHQQSVPILSGREKLRGKLEELKGSKQLEAIKDLGELVKDVTKKMEEKAGWQGQVALVKDLKSKLEELEMIKGLKEGAERLKGKLDALEGPEDLGQLEASKIEEVKTAKKGVVTTLGEKEWGKIGEWEKLQEAWSLEKKIEKEKIAEVVKTAKEEVEKIKVQDKIGEMEREIQDLGALVNKVEEVKDKIEKNLAELEKIPMFKKEAIKNQIEGVKIKLGEKLGFKDELQVLKSRLEELAAIRELKELGLEERLRELAEVKEVKALAEKQKLQGLDAQEGLQLTEKIRALGGQLDLMEGRWREKFKELTQLDEQGVRKNLNPQAIAAVAGKLEEIWALGTLGQLDDLMPGERSKALAEVKETLKQLKDELGLVDLDRKLVKITELEALGKIRKLGELGDLERLGAKKIRELVKNLGALEQEKIQEVEAAGKLVKGRERGGITLFTSLEKLTIEELKKAGMTQLEKLVKELEAPGVTTLPGRADLKNKLEALVAIKELTETQKKLDELSKIKALEELTEIAEKRGVATVMKAALTSAMEITKNRGWTDYLSRVDAEVRSTYWPTLLLT
ncbi:hypothetical protein [Anaplasma centrale]|uniref:hypothetical protein n=1 Tax=Anaplasma centrale TaxID=769 RepID=UPI0002F9A5F1|nr:hypothetical protein [Anaplasma centrale]